MSSEQGEEEAEKCWEETEQKLQSKASETRASETSLQLQLNHLFFG